MVEKKKLTVDLRTVKQRAQENEAFGALLFAMALIGALLIAVALGALSTQ